MTNSARSSPSLELPSPGHDGQNKTIGAKGFLIFFEDSETVETIPFDAITDDPGR